MGLVLCVLVTRGMRNDLDAMGGRANVAENEYIQSGTHHRWKENNHHQFVDLHPSKLLTRLQEKA